MIENKIVYKLYTSVKITCCGINRFVTVPITVLADSESEAVMLVRNNISCEISKIHKVEKIKK